MFSENCGVYFDYKSVYMLNFVLHAVYVIFSDDLFLHVALEITCCLVDCGIWFRCF